MKIILFNNSFDPFNNYHAQMMVMAANKIDADLVILMPTYNNGDHPTPSASFQARLEMCQLGLINNRKTKYLVSDFEYQNQTINYTHNNLVYLFQNYPNADVYLLVDQQQLHAFPEWFNASQIKAMATLISAPLGSELTKLTSFFQGSRTLSLNHPLINRPDQLIQTAPIADDLAPSIIQLINTHGLYAAVRLKKYLSPQRLQHSWRVAETALKITKIYLTQHSLEQSAAKQLQQQAYVSGLYHDIAKELEAIEQIKIAKHQLNITSYPHWKVLHGPVGAWLLKHVYQFDDASILNAIAEHTIPHSINPHILSQIVFLADHLEPERVNKFGAAQFEHFWALLETQSVNACFYALRDYLTKLVDPHQKPFIYQLNS